MLWNNTMEHGISMLKTTTTKQTLKPKINISAWYFVLVCIRNLNYNLEK